MSAPGKQRLIDGPEQDYLFDTEVANYLRFSVRTLERLVAAGRFPRPLQMSDQVRVWSWRDVLFWVLTVELTPRIVVETPTPPGDSQRQPATTKRQPATSTPPAD